MTSRALLPLVLLASGLAATTQARADPPLVLDAQVGPAFLMKSRSKAIGHGFKPMARVGLRASVSPRLEVGGALVGLIDADEHYRVLGVVAQGRFALWRTAAFSTGFGLALGAGYDADILHADLDADGLVAPYGSVTLDARWALGSRWLLGVEGGWHNLSVVTFGLLVGARFDGWGGGPRKDAR